jgi:hypothetical protein
MAVTQVMITEDIRQKLGEEGLRDLTTRLWAMDCQTCGRFLGDDPPTLCVDDLMVFATASLHHQGCRVAEWNDCGAIRRTHGEYVSFFTRMVLLPLPDGENEELWPMILINPGLECVTLKPGPGGEWRVQSDPEFIKAGLVPPGPALKLGVPVEGLIARITDSSVAVTLQIPPFSTYEAPADKETLDCARTRGGVLTGVTHALNPGDFSKEELHKAISSGQILAGWAGSHGPRQAAQPSTPPLGVTCILHWNERHMTVGKLVDHAPKVLSSKKAHSRAERVIGADQGALLPWKLVDENRPNDGWYTMHALSMQEYLLRRHTDGWKLVQVYSSVHGKTVESDNEAKAWARGVLKHKAGISGLKWEPGPTTPGSVTLYASA